MVRDVGRDQGKESLALPIRSQKVSLRHLSGFRVGVAWRVSVPTSERATMVDVLCLARLLEESRQYAEKGNAFQADRPHDTRRFLFRQEKGGLSWNRFTPRH
jgi:hypothetical protein